MHSNYRAHSKTSFYVRTISNPTPIKEVEGMQSIIRMQRKEIERLEHQNRNLMVLNSQQTRMMYEERAIRTKSILSVDSIDSRARDRQSSKPALKEIEKEKQPSQRTKSLHKRLSQLFQRDDHFKIGLLLDQSQTEENIRQAYEDDGTLQLLTEVLAEEEIFLDVVHNQPPQKVSIVYDKIKRLHTEHKQMSEIILKLKVLLTASIDIAKAKLLDEALQHLSKATKQIIKCGQVEVYLLNEETQQLYCNEKRFDIGESIVGYVAQQQQTLNLKNAKHETRFASEDYNVVLASPIIDRTKAAGVIICSEKQEFSNEDESILQLLAQQAKIILYNMLSHDQLITSINKHRHTLESSLLFQQESNKLKLIKLAESRLKALMNCEHSKIRLQEEIQEKGIMGYSIQNKSIIQVQSAYNSPHFCPDVDIKTKLPVVTVPITLNATIIGAMQFTLLRGMLSQSVSSIEQEVLELFGSVFGSILQKLT